MNDEQRANYLKTSWRGGHPEFCGDYVGPKCDWEAVAVDAFESIGAGYSDDDHDALAGLLEGLSGMAPEDRRVEAASAQVPTTVRLAAAAWLDEQEESDGTDIEAVNAAMLARVDRVVQDGRGLDVCPVCGDNDELDYRSVDIDDGAAFQRASCGSCDTSWVEGYTFTRIIEVEDGQGRGIADVVEPGFPLPILANLVDHFAQGPGEGNVRVQLAAVMLRDALLDDPRVTTHDVELIVELYAKFQDIAR